MEISGSIPVPGEVEGHYGAEPKGDEVNQRAEDHCDELLFSLGKPMESHQVEEDTSCSPATRYDDQWDKHPGFENILLG